MKCPTCKDVTLTMTSRQDIEIDYCPECRGVWLDRGELDKLIEKSLAAAPQATQTTAQPQPQQAPPQPYHYKKSDDDYYKDKHYYKKRKSFLSEIFD